MVKICNKLLYFSDVDQVCLVCFCASKCLLFRAASVWLMQLSATAVNLSSSVQESHKSMGTFQSHTNTNLSLPRSHTSQQLA